MDYVETVKALTKPTLAIITTNTEVKLNKKDVETKTIENPYIGTRKLAKMIVELAPQYEKAVNDQRETEGKEKTFEAGARAWGTNLGNGVVDNNGKLYISCILKESQGKSFMFESEPIEESTIDPWMPKKKPSSTNNQGVEEAVKFMTISVDNITSLEIL